MNRGRDVSMANSSGFTILETLIFLAATMAMFVSTMLVVGGMQRKVQFTSATRGFESNLIDIANDVANGYYQNTNNLHCVTASGRPVVSLGTDALGTSIDCIFVGRAITLSGNGTDPEKYDVYSLAGLKQVGNPPEDVETIDEAKPQIIHDTKATRNIGFGAIIRKICTTPTSGFETCADAKDKALVFYTNLKGAATNSSISSNGIHAGLYVYDLSAFGGNIVAAVNSSPIVPTPTSVNKVRLCIDSGTTNQHADTTIGLDRSSNLGIVSTVGDGLC